MAIDLQKLRLVLFFFYTCFLMSFSIMETNFHTRPDQDSKPLVSENSKVLVPQFILLKTPENIACVL